MCVSFFVLIKKIDTLKEIIHSYIYLQMELKIIETLNLTNCFMN